MQQKLFFETLISHWTEELPFVAYRKPNSNTFKAVLQGDDKVYYTQYFTETGFVFAPFDTTKDAMLIQADQQLLCDQISVLVTEENVRQNVRDDYTELVDLEAKGNYLDLVRQTLCALTHENLQKVVLSRAETVCSKDDQNPLERFRRLSIYYPTAMVYCWYHPKIGLWLGATPETLLQVRDGHWIKTMALAGTQLYKGSLNVDWGEKELEEQQLVSNAIMDGLTPLVKELVVSEVYTHKAGGLLHLRTDFEAQMSDVSLQQLLQTLHPTPAVCGLPREQAKHFIITNEKYDREFYTGFLGELRLAYNDETTMPETNLFVNLRCMQLKGKKALVYVGGGITEASIPENEWEETVRKTNTMKFVL